MKRSNWFAVDVGLVVVLGLLTLGSVLVSQVEADTVYSTGGDGTQLVSIDTLTGAGTVIGPTGTTATFGAAFSPSGVLYTVTDSYSSSGRLATLDLTTGAATVFGAPVGVANMMVLEFATDGTLYTASWVTDSLYKMNVTTGVPTLIGSLGFSGVMDFAFDSTGTLWGVNSTDLWKINLTTGAGTHVTAVSGTGGCLMGLAFDAADNLYGTEWCSGNSPLYKIDPSTGVATVVGITGISQPHGGDVLLTAVDSDGDGVPDADDACPDSDLSATVVIDGCNSGVTNTLSPSGCTIADLIAACAEGASDHSQFVSCVGNLTNDLKRASAITGKQKGAIQHCAAQADIP